MWCGIFTCCMIPGSMADKFWPMLRCADVSGLAAGLGVASGVLEAGVPVAVPISPRVVPAATTDLLLHVLKMPTETKWKQGQLHM